MGWIRVKMKKLGLTGLALAFGSYGLAWTSGLSPWLNWIGTATLFTFLAGGADLIVFFSWNIAALLSEQEGHQRSRQAMVAVPGGWPSAAYGSHGLMTSWFHVPPTVSYHECYQYKRGVLVARSVTDMRIGSCTTCGANWIPPAWDGEYLTSHDYSWQTGRPDRYMIHQQHIYEDGHLRRVMLRRFDRITGEDLLLESQPVDIRPRQLMLYHRDPCTTAADGTFLSTGPLRAVVCASGCPCPECGDVHFDDR